jgi:hypothetical protein
MEDFVVKYSSEGSTRYSMDSLRAAFNRLRTENLTCIVTVNHEGYLSVKLLHDS